MDSYTVRLGFVFLAWSASGILIEASTDFLDKAHVASIALAFLGIWAYPKQPTGDTQ